MADEEAVKCNTKATAFSLIEILVVIAIIAMLGVLLFPSYQKMMASAQLGKCVSNLQQLHVAWAQYAADNDGKLLRPYDCAADWNGILTPILSRGNNNYGNHTVYQCPANPCRTGFSWDGTNYSYNSNLGWQSVPDTVPAKTLGQITQPTKLVLMTDAARDPGVVNNNPAAATKWLCWAYLNGVTQDSNGQDIARWTGYQWHNGRANFLFADGHVETLAPDVVQQRLNDNTLLTTIP